MVRERIGRAAVVCRPLKAERDPCAECSNEYDEIELEAEQEFEVVARKEVVNACLVFDKGGTDALRTLRALSLPREVAQSSLDCGAAQRTRE